MANLFGQQRSQSGPAGLSINTGSANSLFASGSNNTNTNSTSQPPQSGGLFGSSKPAGLFGSAASTATSAGTLFGTSAAATTQSSSLFGNTAAAPASKAGTLFGGAASNPQNTGGLFGSQSTNAQPQQQQQQPQAGQQGNMFGSSLFGKSASQPQQSSSLFGNTTAQPQQSSSLFGNNAQPQQQQPQQQGGSLFGSLNQSQSQPQQQSSGLFGAQKSTPSLFSNPPQRNVFSSQSSSTLYPAQQPQRSVFSASIGQYTAASQSVPGVRIDLSNLRPTTRFEDLHETLQKEIVALDSFILSQMAAADDCASALPQVANLTKTIPADVEYCERKLDAAQNSLQTDAGAIDSAKTLVRGDADDARRSFKAIHALRMPAQFHSGGLWNSSVSNTGPSPAGGLHADLLDKPDADSSDSADLVQYFSAQAAEMSKRLEGLTRNIGEVESYLSGVEGQTVAQMQSVRMGRGLDGSGGGARTREDKIRELAGVLREFEGGILTVAGNVGGVREATQELMLGEGGNAWPGRGR